MNPQLYHSGMLRISYKLLSISDALQSDDSSEPAPDSNAKRLADALKKTFRRSTALSSYLLKRFMGDSLQPAIEAQEEDEEIRKETSRMSKSYFDCFGVVRHKALHLYKDHEMQVQFRVIQMPHYTVSLYPKDISDHELFMSQYPIVLTLLDSDIMTMTAVASNSDPHIFIYSNNSSEKESWFVTLKRASNLPLFADEGAMSLYYEEIETVRQYENAMKKLVANTQGEYNQETAWLNALVGRMFVAIHGNANVKEWVRKRLSRHTVENDEEEASLLGDIVIQDIDVGNSLPVLSNPKLVNIEVDGDMLIEMDIHYDGGFRLVLATEATLSVPAWDAYMKPITVPIVVAVKINRFSARILFKIKPFWESNRIWFGFYRQPELKLELEVEPLISNKLIKLQMVNQVIERRIKDSLEAYVMLPNMDDLSFWDFADINGSPFVDATEEFASDHASDIGTMRGASSTGHSTPLLNSSPGAAILAGVSTADEILFANENSVANASMMGEAQETPFDPVKSKLRLRRTRDTSHESHKTTSSLESNLAEKSDSTSGTAAFNPAIKPVCEEHSSVESEDSSSSVAVDYSVSTQESPTSLESPSSKIGYVEYLGDAAYSLGKISRQYGLDTKAQTFVKEYATPALKQLEQRTETYRQVVQTKAAEVGLSAIERLGLSPERAPHSSQSDLSNTAVGPTGEYVEEEASATPTATNLNGNKTLRNKSSKTWSVLGLSIKTSAPSNSIENLRAQQLNQPQQSLHRNTKIRSSSIATSVVLSDAADESGETSPSSSVAESLTSVDLERYNLQFDAETNSLSYRKSRKDSLTRN